MKYMSLLNKLNIFLENFDNFDDIEFNKLRIYINHEYTNYDVKSLIYAFRVLEIPYSSHGGPINDSTPQELNLLINCEIEIRTIIFFVKLAKIIFNNDILIYFRYIDYDYYNNIVFFGSYVTKDKRFTNISKAILPDEILHLNTDNLNWQKLAVLFPNINKTSFYNCQYIIETVKNESEEYDLVIDAINGVIINNYQSFTSHYLDNVYDTFHYFEDEEQYDDNLDMEDDLDYYREEDFDPYYEYNHYDIICEDDEIIFEDEDPYCYYVLYLNRGLDKEIDPFIEMRNAEIRNSLGIDPSIDLKLEEPQLSKFVKTFQWSVETEQEYRNIISEFGFFHPELHSDYISIKTKILKKIKTIDPNSSNFNLYKTYLETIKTFDENYFGAFKMHIENMMGKKYDWNNELAESEIDELKISFDELTRNYVDKKNLHYIIELSSI